MLSGREVEASGEKRREGVLRRYEFPCFASLRFIGGIMIGVFFFTEEMCGEERGEMMHGVAFGSLVRDEWDEMSNAAMPVWKWRKG
jgi:hypothetical protein